MRNSFCDMCGKETSNLFELLECYRTKEIKDLCNECIKPVNNQLFNLRQVNHGWISRMLRVFIRHKKSRIKQRVGGV